MIKSFQWSIEEPYPEGSLHPPLISHTSSTKKRGVVSNNAEVFVKKKEYLGFLKRQTLLCPHSIFYLDTKTENVHLIQLEVFMKIIW